MVDVLHATGFKRALDLFKLGRFEDASILLRGLQDEYLAMCDENQTLKKQLSEVAEVLDLAQNVEYDGQKYWLKEGNERKGPFCQVCYDREGLLIHLQPNRQHWECQHCKSMFMTTSKVESQRPPRKETKKKTSKPVPLFLGQELG